MSTPLLIRTGRLGWAFFFISMSEFPYTKPALNYSEQIQLLKDRGLIIDNEPKALHLLEVISYFRLSGYWYPLLSDKQNHIFKEHASFETAFSIYKFDRELRLLVLQELEKIEVAVRAKMIYILSHNRGIFWYQDSKNFSNPRKHADTISKVNVEFSRSDDDFIQSFKSKYSDPFPPSWMMLEISSFGNLSALYGNLLPCRDKREIAKYFALHDKTLTSWLHSIVYLRNICAHHTRLWNRELRIQPLIPHKPFQQFLNKTRYVHPETGYSLTLNNKVYFVLSMILYLMNIINPKNNFKENLISLLTRYRNIDPRAMGFPEDWKSEPLWG